MKLASESVVAGVIGSAILIGSPAHALTMKECSAKYSAAKTSGTLNGMKWTDFRKAECGASAAAEPAAAPVRPTRGSAAPAAPVSSGSAVFPPTVSAKYSSESAGKARMHTCLDQYNTNKASGGNSGLKWIAKGGGYYSECNKRLKG